MLEYKKGTIDKTPSQIEGDKANDDAITASSTGWESFMTHYNENCDPSNGWKKKLI